MPRQPAVDPAILDELRRVTRALVARLDNQTAVAEATGLAQQTISKIINGGIVGVKSAKLLVAAAKKHGVETTLPEDPAQLERLLSEAEDMGRLIDARFYLEPAMRVVKQLIDDGVPPSEARMIVGDALLRDDGPAMDELKLYAAATKILVAKARAGAPRRQYKN